MVVRTKIDCWTWWTPF